MLESISKKILSGVSGKECKDPLLLESFTIDSLREDSKGRIANVTKEDGSGSTAICLLNRWYLRDPLVEWFEQNFKERKPIFVPHANRDPVPPWVFDLPEFQRFVIDQVRGLDTNLETEIAVSPGATKVWEFINDCHPAIHDYLFLNAIKWWISEGVDLNDVVFFMGSAK